MAAEIETPGAGPVPDEPAAVSGTGEGTQSAGTEHPGPAEGTQPTSPGHPGPAGSERIRLAQGREHVVATVAEIPPGSSKVVPIGRHGVGVYNVNGTFYAIANYCPHEGGPLCAGRARGRTVVDESVPGDSVMVRDNEFIYCPWHQWGFELATGTTAVKPEWSIRTYPVRVVGEDVLVTA
jgi:nitrite reductase/ring-hydroxylating ferredoxin subunit